MENDVPFALSLRNLSVNYGRGAMVLENITLDVTEGEFVTFVGASGCGKSTLLRVISGLIRPTEGEVRIGARPPGFGADLFHVFQEPNLLPWKRVRANVALPLRLQGASKSDTGARIDPLLDWVGLKESANMFPRQLSGGMKMRVSLARALSVNPRLLLLDEPFGALDEMLRFRMNEELLRLQARIPFTGLFVTHSVVEAVFLSSRVVVLSPRPGTILDTFHIPFAFPRTADLRKSPEYYELSAQISSALERGMTASR